MSLDITSILGGSLVDSIKGLINQFHASPEDKLKLQELVDQNASELALKQLDLQQKLDTSLSSEIAAGAEIIKAEAGSQSWLPKNVRPLLLLFWGSAITFNIVVAVISHVSNISIQPIVLDPWVYKLTAIGFTGYATLRSVEKVLDKDN